MNFHKFLSNIVGFISQDHKKLIHPNIEANWNVNLGVNLDVMDSLIFFKVN